MTEPSASANPTRQKKVKGQRRRKLTVYVTPAQYSELETLASTGTQGSISQIASRRYQLGCNAEAGVNGQ